MISFVYRQLFLSGYILCILQYQKDKKASSFDKQRWQRDVQSGCDYLSPWPSYLVTNMQSKDDG